MAKNDAKPPLIPMGQEQWGAVVVVTDNGLNVSADEVSFDELALVSRRMAHVAEAWSAHGHYTQTMRVQLVVHYM